MPTFGILLRCLLIVAFCLEGSMSLWVSSAMAADRAGHVDAAQGSHPPLEQDCEDDAQRDQGGSAHEDCDCGSGLGCACACMFPVAAMVPVVPFAARHLLATGPAVPSWTAVVPTAIAPVFRPPIG